MPKRSDLRKILLIGSGPIVIGQACEFDYSGTQACKALREEGFEVVLVNSNPATIMTDPETADRTYVEPLTPEFVAKVIERERPQALLPTLGGQTGLNLAVALAEDGTLDRFGPGGLVQGRPGHGPRRGRDPPRGRRVDGRLELPVRGDARRRAHGGDRDEPAGVALVRARLQGHVLPDRQDRGQARGRLHAR